MITGLNAKTDYYVKSYAKSSYNIVYGSQVKFTTSDYPPPSAITGTASYIALTRATLNGVINPCGQSTSVTFEYGTTADYGSTVTATKSPVTGDTKINVTADITGLTQKTTYHFRVKAVNGAGTAYGSDNMFVTRDIQEFPTSGLVVYYPFNGNANDESGNNNSGTIMGGATTNGHLIIGNNASDRISVPHTVLHGLNDFTCSANLKINAIHISGSTYPLNSWIHGWRAGDDNSFAIYFFKNRGSVWRITFNNNAVAWGSNTIIEDNDWHHLLVLRSGTIARLYIDGKQVGNGITVSGSSIKLDPGCLVLGQEIDLNGAFDKNQSWAGEMDNFRVYNRALSEGEIQVLFETDDF